MSKIFTKQKYEEYKKSKLPPTCGINPFGGSGGTGGNGGGGNGGNGGGGTITTAYSLYITGSKLIMNNSSTKAA